MCMENALLAFLLIHGFRARFLTSFAQHPPASLCASRPIFSSEELFTSVSETCMHHGAIRRHYLISLRTKMNPGVSLWNISVCFDYNIQVLWLTSNRCWADVGERHRPNVEAMLGRHRTTDIDPTPVKRRPNTCSFVVFLHSIICQNYSVPKSSQCWKQRSFLVQSWYGYKHTVHQHENLIHINTLRLRKKYTPFPDAIFKCIFLNENI